LRQSKTVIDDYAKTAGLRRIENDATDGHQRGNPVKGAELIIKAVYSAEPPTLLLLGSDAVEIVLAALDADRQQVEAWAKESITTDFTE
jgi:hypothetical protein